MTVKELLNECQNQVKAGNGDKSILISQDDEGNGFHPLYYSFTDDKETITQYRDMGVISSGFDNNIVLLG